VVSEYSAVYFVTVDMLLQGVTVIVTKTPSKEFEPGTLENNGMSDLCKITIYSYSNLLKLKFSITKELI
jgi:hypothetical protein